MRVWLACFLVLFALAELFDWVKAFQVQLPLPIYILGGAFLAVASNYDKLFGSYFSGITTEATLDHPQLDSLPEPAHSISLTSSRAVEDCQQSEMKS